MKKIAMIVMAVLVALNVNAEMTSELTESNLQFRIAAMLMAHHPQIRKHGRPYAQQQMEWLVKRCDELGNVGVVSKRQFEIMVAELVVVDLPPQTIADGLSAMADVLVANKGTQVSDKDAAEFAAAWVEVLMD